MNQEKALLSELEPN